MDENTIRLKCLELATQNAQDKQYIMSLADLYYHFVKGNVVLDESNCVKHTS